MLTLWGKPKPVDAAAMEKHRERVFRLAPRFFAGGAIFMAAGVYFGLLPYLSLVGILSAGLLQARVQLLTLRDSTYSSKHPFLYLLPQMIVAWIILGNHSSGHSDASSLLADFGLSLLRGACAGAVSLTVPSLLFWLFREPFLLFVRSPLPANEHVAPVKAKFCQLEPAEYAAAGPRPIEPSDFIPKFPVNY